MATSLQELAIVRASDRAWTDEADCVAVEEPLEIRVKYPRQLLWEEKTLSITMRTPGDDLDLVMGFLLTEGIVQSHDDVTSLAHCGTKAPETTSNIVRATLHGGTGGGGTGGGGTGGGGTDTGGGGTGGTDAGPAGRARGAGHRVDLARLERHFYTTSSCGVCGKTSLEAVRTVSFHPIEPGPRFRASTITALPDRLREGQPMFARTGGLHGAGLVRDGDPTMVVREDVGRHNAVDKLIGQAARAGELPLTDHALVLSGRASFELVQKARMAGIAIIVAVGAPSSLAVDLARAEGMTLVGFTRGGTFNIYAGADRIARTD